jgi:hypothetical protein
MRTAEEILKENFAWIPKSLAPDNIYDKFLAQMKTAINEARKQAIEECAKRAETMEEDGWDSNGEHYDYRIVDKQSILSLIDELK